MWKGWEKNTGKMREGGKGRGKRKVRKKEKSVRD
jgi:hypothetical protein